MIYILIPIYNEAQNLTSLFSRLGEIKNTLNQDLFVVFSDDGSKDGSRELIQKEYKHSSFEVLGDGKNFGPGHAFNVGFEFILGHSENTNDVVVTMEADGTSDIGILPDMLAVSNLGYSLVLASVYAQGGGFDQTSFFRKLISFIANMIFRSIFDIKVLTLSSFYRVYHVSLLKSIRTNSKIISENGFICMLEVLLKAINNGAKVVEIPMVLHSAERKGKSKMKIIPTTISYLKFAAKYKSS